MQLGSGTDPQDRLAYLAEKKTLAYGAREALQVVFQALAGEIDRAIGLKWPDAADYFIVLKNGLDVLDAAHAGATLADLYDPLTMPPNLRKAHDALDRVVDAAYGQPRGFPTEAARLAFLFTLYQSRAAPLDAGGGSTHRAVAKPKEKRLPKPKPGQQLGLLDSGA